MNRMLLVPLALLLCLPVSAQAQGTPMPHPLIQWFDNTGLVFSDGGLCVFVAGTSTAATTYTTAALSVANSNPIEFDAAGRPTSGGVWLTPGSSYKFVLKNFAGVSSPTCIPDTGVTVWTVDNVPAVPGSAAAVDATITAGESITAGDAVYVSDGTGSLNAGQIYKMDADLTYKSTKARMVGIAPNAITSGNAGTVRLSGSVTVAGPLTPGAPYYAGASAGAIVATPPTNAIRLGVSQTSTVLLVGFNETPVAPRGPPCGRLTLTSGLPVTINDVSAATTIYYTPAGSCNSIFLYDGTSWADFVFAEISIAVPATTNTGYDVFAYDNAGTVALELTAWTNLTTRATALAFQNGVYVKSGTPTRRLVGSFRTTGVSGQTEDSITKRYVNNLHNQVPRAMFKTDANANWDYSTATIRQAGGVATNQVEVFVSVQNAMMDLVLTGHATNSTGVAFAVGIGEDSTSTFLSASFSSGASQFSMTTRVVKMPAVGHHTYSWNEWSAATPTTTFYGTSGASTPAGTTSGLRGWIMG